MPCCTPRRAQARPRGLGICTAGPTGTGCRASTTRQFQESRAQPLFPLRFRHLMEEPLRKPAPLQPDTHTNPSLQGLLLPCHLSTQDRSTLNHIKLGDTPTIKTSAPQERCSPDYFHELIGAERQHFRFTRCKSQESQSLSMNEAGRHMSF